jgi:hypothetical protein
MLCWCQCNRKFYSKLFTHTWIASVHLEERLESCTVMIGSDRCNWEKSVNDPEVQRCTLDRKQKDATTININCTESISLCEVKIFCKKCLVNSLYMYLPIFDMVRLPGYTFSPWVYRFLFLLDLPFIDTCSLATYLSISVLKVKCRI